MFEYPSECELPDGIWSEELDPRGSQFRIEFEQEVQKALMDEVQTIKN
jgi:hypothetical protein